MLLDARFREHDIFLQKKSFSTPWSAQTLQGVKGFAEVLSMMLGDLQNNKKIFWGGWADAQGSDKITGKQTLDPLNPGILEPFLPTKWEKNHI